MPVFSRRSPASTNAVSPLIPKPPQNPALKSAPHRPCRQICIHPVCGKTPHPFPHLSLRFQAKLTPGHLALPVSGTSSPPTPFAKLPAQFPHHLAIFLPELPCPIPDVRRGGESLCWACLAVQLTVIHIAMAPPRADYIEISHYIAFRNSPWQEHQQLLQMPRRRRPQRAG